jgi:formyl-CoA transferase
MTNEACERSGNALFLGNAPCEVFKCKPGGLNDYVFIYTSRANNIQWELLCDVIGHPELKEEPRFSTPIKRGDHVSEINKHVENWTRTSPSSKQWRSSARWAYPAAR